VRILLALTGLIAVLALGLSTVAPRALAAQGMQAAPQGMQAAPQGMQAAPQGMQAAPQGMQAATGNSQQIHPMNRGDDHADCYSYYVDHDHYYYFEYCYYWKDRNHKKWYYNYELYYYYYDHHHRKYGHCSYKYDDDSHSDEPYKQYCEKH